MSSLTSIDRLASFQVPEKPETSTHQLEATNTESQQPSIVEMYLVTAALSKLFQGFGYKYVNLYISWILFVSYKAESMNL